MARQDTFRKLYKYLADAERTSTPITRAGMATAAGVKESSIKAYQSKKLSRFVKGPAAALEVQGIVAFTEDDFVSYMSQVATKSESVIVETPTPPVQVLLNKARQAALLAVETYNRPSSEFRTENYSMLMVVAWTALFHAIFERDGTDYRHRGKDGAVITVDGEDKAWELSHCIKATSLLTQAMEANLDFMVRLRNKIEHRFVPALDLRVSGESQACLLNFEEVLVSEFGETHALGANLALPLQLSRFRTPEQNAALRHLQAQNFDDLADFLEGYRSSLDETVYASPQFSFRAFLVPKVGNHASSSDISIEFVHYDPADPERFADIEKRIALTREKKVAVASLGRHRPGAVIAEVKKRLGITLSARDHSQAWKVYGVRQPGEPYLGGCDGKMCVYDDAFRQYVYTDEWIAFLVDQFRDRKELDRVRRFREVTDVADE